MSSLHEDITVEMQRILSAQLQDDIVTPDSLADAAMAAFFDVAKLEPHNHYLSREQAKQIARHTLARSYNVEGNESAAYQGELFSGRLQDRYPIPRKLGEEPAYKKLGILTDDEIAWNVAKLRKSAVARLQHADALEAYGAERPVDKPISDSCTATTVNEESIV